jgi:hypothetical protein
MIRRFLSNPFFLNTRTEKHVPRFPGAPVNSPGIGSPVTPQLTSTDASGLPGPVFAQGGQASPLGGSGAFGLQAIDVVLSSAQILALQTTAVALVPAPAAGFTIVPKAVKIIVFGGSAAYTDAGGAVQVVVGGRVYALASNAVFLTVTTPNRQILDTVLTGVVGAAGNPPSDDGAACNINKITNNFAAGTGTAKVTLYYTIEPTT